MGPSRGGTAGPLHPASARTGAPQLPPVHKPHKCRACGIKLKSRRPALCRICAERLDALQYAKPNTKWTPDDKARLRELWNSGFTHAVIARDLGRTTSAVLNAAGKQGLRTHPRENWRVRWRPEHDDLLRRRYGCGPAAMREVRAALLTEFRKHQIRSRAEELGLAGTQLRRWTPAEDRRLREMTAHGYAIRTIAKNLGRTVSAVKNRRLEQRWGAAALGYYSAADMAEGLGVGGKVVTRWISEGLLTGRLGEDCVWRIAVADARRFLLAHPHRWSLRSAAKAWLLQCLTSCCKGPDRKEVS